MFSRLSVSFLSRDSGHTSLSKHHKCDIVPHIRRHIVSGGSILGGAHSGSLLKMLLCCFLDGNSSLFFEVLKYLCQRFLIHVNKYFASHCSLFSQFYKCFFFFLLKGGPCTMKFTSKCVQINATKIIFTKLGVHGHYVSPECFPDLEM